MQIFNCYKKKIFTYKFGAFTQSVYHALNQ